MDRIIRNPIFTSVAVLLTILVFLLVVAPARAEGTADYVIKAGDALIRIANRYNITLADLLAVNPQISDPNALHPGDVIKLPAARGEGVVAAPLRPIYFWEVEKDGGRVVKEDHMYRVNGGDNYWRIAARYGITFEDLVAANPQASPFRLLPGELLYIPVEKLPEGVFTFYETPVIVNE